MRKPVAIRISNVNRREVVYKCPQCDQSFAFFGESELFCHRCGQQIDWNVVVRLNTEIPCDYYTECKVIDELNKQQL